MRRRIFKTRSLDTADFEREPDLEGVVVEMGSLEVDEEERPFMVIDTGQRLVRVFHSSALKEAFDCAEKGDNIHLEYRGKVKLQGGKSFKRIAVQVWNDGEEEDDNEESQTSKSQSTE